MPQEFQILRCYSCETFQVQFVKKVPKWQCKICNEKQSVKKIYFKGSGKNCRIQVQKLNELRSTLENLDSDVDDFNENSQPPSTVEAAPSGSFNSKWKEYLDDSEGESRDHEKCKLNQDVIEKNEEFALISTTPSHDSTQPQNKRDCENETLHINNRVVLENEQDGFIPKKMKTGSSCKPLSNQLFDSSIKENLDDILNIEF